jgi:hypothetical protein
VAQDLLNDWYWRERCNEITSELRRAEARIKELEENQIKMDLQTDTEYAEIDDGPYATLLQTVAVATKTRLRLTYRGLGLEFDDVGPFTMYNPAPDNWDM